MVANLLQIGGASAVVFTALLFVRACVHKINDFVAFTGFVEDYKLVPARLASAFGAMIVAGEAFIVIGSLLPWTRPAAMMIAAALLVIYAVGIAINLMRGRGRIECGCGGPAQAISPALILRNVVLGVIALFGLAAANEAFAFIDLLAAFLASLAFFGVYLLAEQIIANFTVIRLGRQQQQ